MPGKHSSLGASSAYRWFACPGSVRLCEGIVGTESKYAKEGTRAHALAAQCLRTGVPAREYVGSFFSDEGDWHPAPLPEAYACNFWNLVTPEMAEAVQVYLDIVSKIVRASSSRAMDIEVKLDLSNLYPGMYGTADCKIYDVETGELWVLDYKHGAGVVVVPENNPQLLYYAVGAALACGNQKLTTIHLAIVQPRATNDAVKWWDVDAVDLLEFADKLVTAAKATAAEDAPLYPGSHCGWCPAQPIPGRCKAVTALTEPTTLETFGGPVYDPQALSSALSRVKQLSGWIKSVETFALAELQHGKAIPGYKLVQKRGRRRWANETEASRALLGSGYEETEIMEPATLKSPAALESVVGKKEVAELVGDYIVSESSGLAYAPETDSRPAVNRDLKLDFEPVD